MEYPKYVIIDDEKYNINTDFRVAIKCSSIANDKNIGDYERALAIIYKLFGKKGLEAKKHHDELLRLGLKYLSCGQDVTNEKEEPDMDFEEDMDYIEASFMSDYHIDLSETKMHWWKFYNLINGLSNSEMGNCCILNRIRNIRNYDTSKIDDKKEYEKIMKAKQQFALKKNKKEENLSEEQLKSIEEFNKIFIS